MKNRFMFAVVALAGTCCVTNGQIIISEVASGSMINANPKFVELTNVSATATITLGAGDTLRIFSNAASTSGLVYDFGANSGANNVTLLPGQSWTVASNASNPSGSAVSSWNQAYGIGNQPSFYASTVSGNGNDAYELVIGGVRSDIYGIPAPAAGSTLNANDFTMTWAYSRSFARRQPSVCAPSATFNASQWIIGGNNALGATPSSDTYATTVGSLTSPNSHFNTCATGNDCNNNGRPDATDIALGFSRDCNANSVPDECEITANAALDCNNNGRLDSCEIALNAALDCNRNSVLDSCEIASNDCNGNGILDRCDIASGFSQDVNANLIPDSCEPFLFDCNGNQTEDATDITSGFSRDCNTNLIPDECELFNGRLTDVNGNGTPDACEGAYVGEATLNATVQPSPFGVRNAPNGEAFMNIEGSALLTFASYGGLRFDIAPMAAKFDAAYGAGNWSISSAYLYLQQANAAFTAGGDVEIVHTNNDSINLANNAVPEVTFYDNYLTDYTDLTQVTQYTFAQGPEILPGNPIGSGTIESYKIADGISGNPGMIAVRSELASGSGTLSLLLHEASPSVAATYAGITNFTWAGPTLVVFATGGGTPSCDPCPADYNQDGGVDGGDIESFFADWEASAGCADTNLDGGVDGGDIEAFFFAWENGGC